MRVCTSRTLLLAAFLLTTSSAQAAVPQTIGAKETTPFGPQASADPTQLQLKYAAVEAQAEAASLLDRLATPPASRLNLYVGQRASGLRIQNASFTIEGVTQFVARFNATEASALVESDGLSRIARINIEPGSYLIHVEFDFSASGPSDQSINHVSLDQQVKKVPGEMNLEFSLVSAGLLSSTRIDVKQVRSDDARRGWLKRTLHDVRAFESGDVYTSGSDTDPAMIYARYLDQAYGPEAGLVERLRVALEAADDVTLPIEYWLATAAASRAVGILDRDREICDQLDPGNAGKQTATAADSSGGTVFVHAPVTDVTDQAAIATEKLHLGEAYYESGDLEQAESQFNAARSRLPEFLQPDWRLGYALLLFSQHRTAEVVKLLKQTDSDGVEAFRYMSQGDDALRAAAYRRFNLAVAMVAQHTDEQGGLTWLDLDGRLRSRDEDLLALRDKANITLGWHFLKAKEGKSAIGILGRVRIDGLFSNSALLGMGWAQLAPRGSKQRRVRLGDESAEHPDPFLDLAPIMRNSLTQLGVLEPETHGGIGPRSFEHDDPPADRKEGLRRAIQFWEQLTNRDIHDPAVQEGLLAIAYAYDQLDDHDHAHEAYTRAIGGLEGVRKELEESAASVQRGELSAATAQANDEPALFLVMDRFRLAPGESNRELYATVDRARSFSVSEEALKKLDERLSAIGDNRAGVHPGTLKETDPPGDSLTDATAAVNALRARIQSLETALVAGQAEAGHRIDQIALSNLDDRQRTLEKYLQAAYFSTARVNDRVAH